MKAIQLQGINTPFSIFDLPQPEPTTGQALVKIEAAAFNHRDLWIRKGQYAGLKWPIVPGSDGAGTLVGGPRDGEAVIINPSLGWGQNERVQSKTYGIVGLPTDGTFAEYLVVPEANIYAMPAHLSFEEAAALPLAGLTAWRAVFSRAGLQAGERVLVTGAGGGVALFAVQFALAAGAQVFVTSGSDEKLEKARALGVAGGANYRKNDWHSQLREQAGGFDVIIDSAGGEAFGKLVDLANPGGRIAFYGGTMGAFPALSPQKIFWKQLSLLGSTMGSDRDFADMLAFVNAHQICPVVDRVFPLEEAETAAAHMESAGQFGKVVLKI